MIIPTRFINVLICPKVDVEISVVKEESLYYISIMICPAIEIIYKKSHGLAWSFDSEEDAWDFITNHTQFDLDVILIELGREFTKYRHSTDTKSEYQMINHKMLNIREYLGLHKIFNEVVARNSTCSLRLNATYVYCQEKFGGYGYQYNFGYYEDRVSNFINFSAKEICTIVNLNRSIGTIIKSLDIATIATFTLEHRMEITKKPEDENPEVNVYYKSRIEQCTYFVGFLRRFL